MKRKLIILFFLITILNLNATQITLWHAWAGEEKIIMLGLIAKYEQLTGEKVKVKKIPFHALSARYIAYTKQGKGPDVIIGPSDWIGNFLINDLIEPIDKYIKEEEKEDFIKMVLNSCKYKDTLYGLPESYKLNALIYNKKIVPKPPVTTNEMIKIGRDILEKDNGIYPLMYKYKSFYYHSCWIGGYGGKIIDENDNTTFNLEPTKKSIEFVKKIMTGENEILADETDEEMIMSMFLAGKVGMMINGSWILGDLMKSDINFGIARIPLLNDTGKWASPLLGAEIVMMSSKTKNKKGAINLIKYLTSEDSQFETVKIGHIPSRKSLYEYKEIKNKKIFKHIKKFMNQAKVATPMPTASELGIGIWSNGSGILHKIFSLNEKIDKVLENVQNIAEKDIEKFRKKNSEE
ncbi:MAG: hypothetical protein B6I28_03870 [Fusobacteriia bacterium 4572_132]|nr:MAG: hypothetical protein B6I28_03870 [Fusobacteriia bacterium 4572_132]